MEHDPEVQGMVRRWPPPNPPGMDERMMSLYKTRRFSWWRRRVDLRIAIPAPILATGILFGLLLGGWWSYRASEADSLRERMNGYEPVKAPALTVISGVGR